MFLQSAPILPSASAQAVNTPTAEQESQPTGCNAEPCPVIPSSSTSADSLQSFATTGSVTGITDPTLIPNSSVYDFSADVEFSAPTSFPGGIFSGDRQVRVVGDTWSTWNPQIDGKHVLFAPSDTIDILFTSPQVGIVVKAEPNIMDWFNITVEAFDSGGASLGSFTQSINGNGGASFLGVLSTSDNIAKITLRSDPAANGFAFSDLTYGSSSCSGVTLSPIAQAVLAEVDPQEYCGNQYDSLITLPPGRNAFERFSTLAENIALEPGPHEIDFATMGWFPDQDPDKDDEGPGEIFLQGVKVLYDAVDANPTAYEGGVKVRILLGLKYYSFTDCQDQRLYVMDDLDRLGIEREDINWSVEVAAYRNASQQQECGLAEISGTHSHVKMMIVDGKDMIASGYNMDYIYLQPPTTFPYHDMGVQISGPVAQHSLQVFDNLWKEAYRCDEATANFDNCIVESRTETTADHDPSIQVPVSTGENIVFSLFRDHEDKTADDAIAAAIRAANSEINVIQNRFMYSNNNWYPLEYGRAILDALQKENSVDVNILASGGVDIAANVNGMCNLYVQLFNEAPLRLLNLKFRISSLFTNPIHTKALSIDNKFTIVGSQNFDPSAWGSGYLSFGDLAEYSLGIDSEQAANDFKTKLEEVWGNSSKSWPLLCVDNILEDLEDRIEAAVPGSVVFVPSGVYTEAITINKPLTLVGAGASETIIHPNGNQPAFRVTSSDVTIMNIKISEGAGYGIELIDSSPSSLKNIQINRVVFENNAQGGVLAQGLITGSPMNYAIENSTFIGGANGIAINMIETQTDTSIIRNNIFSGQSNAPIYILSADDSHVEYSYNLFDDCGLGACTANWKQGNLSASSSSHDNLFDLDPLFASLENGAYQLSTGSPAIDAGDPSLLHEFFYDGDNDNIVQIDIGAFEYVPVENVAPVVNAGTDQTVDLGNSLTVNATYTDADNSENHSARINWGDETVEDVPVNMTGPGAGEVIDQHTYVNAGNYTVEVCVTDLYGGMGCDRLFVTVTPPPDLIFKDGFESGDFSRWDWADTDGGDLSVSTQAAAVGNYGMQAVMDDVTELVLYDETPVNETHYSARFYFDPNSVDIGPDRINLISDTYWNFCLYLEQEGVNYSLALCGMDDADNWLEADAALITDGWQSVEIEWQASSAPGANNGYIKLWVGDVLVASIENIDSDTQVVSEVNLGVMDIPTGTSGTMYFDAFESHKGSHIGLDPNGPTVYSPLSPPDLIFADNFESGNFSLWSNTITDGGDLSISTSAAYQGSYGLTALIDDKINLRAIDASPVNETHYRSRFYFNANSLTMSNGNAFYIFDGINLWTGDSVFRIELIRESGVYKLRVRIMNDAYIYTTGSKFTIGNAWRPIEIEWQASSAPGANNGFLTLWIDGALKQTISTIDNDQHKIGEIQLGAVSGIDSGTSGSMLFDNFESRRNSYIGP